MLCTKIGIGRAPLHGFGPLTCKPRRLFIAYKVKSSYVSVLETSRMGLE